MKITKILNYIFPFQIFKNLFISSKPYLCRHEMRYWDMKWYMSDPNAPKYNEFNGKIWKDVFCQCQKCGVKYRMDMRPKKWGVWIKSDFTPTKSSFIEVEIFQYGHSETKSQKRDRLINNLLK